MTDADETGRPRDASRTARELLTAAQDLFGRHGYERTTLRHIGERAGVDSSLIARYFGNKASLYIACLEADDPQRVEGSDPHEAAGESVIARVIDRTTRFGPTPVLQAIVKRADDPTVGRAARKVLAHRTLGPLREAMAAAGVDRAELRAEVAVAALAGIALGRAAGTLRVLADAATPEVIEVAEQLLSDLVDGGLRAPPP